jgi:hypothetical protein
MQKTRQLLVQGHIEEEAERAIKAGKSRQAFLRSLAKDKRIFAALGLQWAQVRAIGVECYDRALEAPAETSANALDLSPTVKPKVAVKSRRRSRAYQAAVPIRPSGIRLGIIFHRSLPVSEEAHS